MREHVPIVLLVLQMLQSLGWRSHLFQTATCVLLDSYQEHRAADSRDAAVQVGVVLFSRQQHPVAVLLWAKCDWSMRKKVIMKKIQEVADKIAREFKPEKIILFGSWAWGKPNEDSDRDFVL